MAGWDKIHPEPVPLEHGAQEPQRVHRARRVHLTAAGRARHAAAQSDIRAMEDELLATLSAAERKLLLTVLPRLTAEH